MVLQDTISDSEIPALVIDGMLHVADHPLPAEDADELIVIKANDEELADLDRGGYRWKWIDATP